MIEIKMLNKEIENLTADVETLISLLGDYYDIFRKEITELEESSFNLRVCMRQLISEVKEETEVEDNPALAKYIIDAGNSLATIFNQAHHHFRTFLFERIEANMRTRPSGIEKDAIGKNVEPPVYTISICMN